MSFGKFLFKAVADFIGLALAFVDIVAQSLLTFAMAGLAGTVYHSQRTLYMVVAELHATFTLIGHVAVRTRYATLTVNAHPGYFKIGVLRFQDGGTAQLMYIVVETGLIIIGFHVFHRKTFVPGESQVLAVTLEVIFHVALCTYQRAHLLRSGLGNILALTFKSFYQSRTADMQIHIFRFVAVRTTNRIYNFTTQSAPLIIIESIHTDGFHHTGDIGTLASPASGRLRTICISGRRTGTQGCRNILDGMHVSARSGIVFGEGISSPKYHHFGTLFQYIHSHISIEFTLEVGLGGFSPRLILTWKVTLEDFVACLNSFNHSFAVIEYTCQLGPALHQGRNA